MDPAKSDLLGICRISGCGAEQLIPGTLDGKSGRCFQHTVFLFLHKRGVIANVAQKNMTIADEEKRLKLALKLRAYYNGLMSGSEPCSQAQRLQKSYELRRELRIKWGGPKGMLTLAEVIKDVENLAQKVLSWAA